MQGAFRMPKRHRPSQQWDDAAEQGEEYGGAPGTEEEINAITAAMGAEETAKTRKRGDREAKREGQKKKTAKERKNERKIRATYSIARRNRTPSLRLVQVSQAICGDLLAARLHPSPSLVKHVRERRHIFNLVYFPLPLLSLSGVVSSWSCLNWVTKVTMVDAQAAADEEKCAVRRGGACRARRD